MKISELIKNDENLTIARQCLAVMHDCIEWVEIIKNNPLFEISVLDVTCRKYIRFDRDDKEIIVKTMTDKWNSDFENAKNQLYKVLGENNE